MIRCLARVSRVLGAVCALCFFSTADAAKLYAGTVPVADRSEEARETALRAALGQVLVKLSGDASAARWAASQGGLDGASANVGLETYLTRPPRPDPDRPANVLQAPELYLQAEFSPSYVDPLLRRLDLPLWSTRRNPILVWLAIEDEQGDRGVVGEERPELLDALARGAERRGLEIVNPILDTVDRAAVTPEHVWGGLWEDIEAASERYGTPLLMAVRVEPRAAVWHAGWSLKDGENVDEWTSRGRDAYDALESGLVTAADTLGDRYALRVGEVRSNVVTAAILGVDSVGDYGRLLEFLRDHSLVDAVAVERLDDEEMRVALTLNASREAFLSSLTLSDVLRESTLENDDPFARDRPADVALELL